MSKFNVGDKVRVIAASELLGLIQYIGKTATITKDDGTGWEQYRIDLDDGRYPWNDTEFQLIAVEPRREFIVIRRSGAETIAELRHDREVIKSAKATCAPTDAFDLDTGAKLAFDRLMGREEPKLAPQPAHRFKVGDRVVGEYGNGEVSSYNSNIANQYLVYFPDIKQGHSGHLPDGVASKKEHQSKCRWQLESELSPAPESPKFYTGKVFAEKSVDVFFQKRDGHVFEFVDGYCENATPDQQMGGRFCSFDDFCHKASFTTWHEVKSDV